MNTHSLQFRHSHMGFNHITNQSFHFFPTNDNRIGNEGVKVIANAIKYNTSVKELDLSGNIHLIQKSIKPKANIK